MNQVSSHHDDDGLDGGGSALPGAGVISETAPTTSTSHHLSPTKNSMASILRNPILRLRRRRHTEKSSLVTGVVEVSASSVSSIVEWEERVDVFEEAKVEKTEIRLAPRPRARIDGGIPHLEITVDEDHHEATFYHRPGPQESSETDRTALSPPLVGGGRMTVGTDSSSHQPLPHRHKLAGRSIMKYRDSNVPRTGRFHRSGRKSVSFDESTIVPRQDKKSIIDNVALAMPAILPYLIAVLILILSSLVPPDPQMSGRIVNSKKRHRPVVPVGSQSSPPLPTATTLSSTTATTILNSNSPHITTSGGNSYFEWSKRSIEPFGVDESGGQNSEEGPQQLLYDGQPQETDLQARQELDKSHGQSKRTSPPKNPFLKVWRAIKRDSKTPTR